MSTINYNKNIYGSIWNRVLVFTITLLLFSFSVKAQRNVYTYISYPSSSIDWATPTTPIPPLWVLDVNGGDALSPTIPQNSDSLIILGNKEVYLNGNVNLTGLRIYISNGSTLDLRGYTFTNDIKVYGTGTLKVGSATLPNITNSDFFGTSGGTVEYYNFTGSLPARTQYKHLIIKNGTGLSNTITINNNITTEGNFSVLSNTGGTITVQIGASTTIRTIEVKGNTIVGSSAFLTFGTDNAIHSFIAWGDFTNNGSIDFTNAAQYATATRAVNLTFRGGTDNTFTGTGSRLDLYRLFIDKGADKTYVLDANPTNLTLNYPITGNSTSKALRLQNGTLKLGANISIPSLTEYAFLAGSDDFTIPQTAGLWISGATVNVTSNTGTTFYTSINVEGSLRVSEGVLNTNKSGGIMYSGRASILIEGGTTTISQLRPYAFIFEDPDHTASFELRGGVFTVNGSGENSYEWDRFSIPYPNNTFKMSGGELNISNPDDFWGFYTHYIGIGVNPGNASVTGGTVNIYGSGTDYNICSSAPFFNLNLYNNSTINIGATDKVTTAYPLVVNNNLILNANVTLLANNYNVSIAGNFTLESGATYTPGTNTTTFFYNNISNINGSTITNNATAPLSFYNLSLAKLGGSSYDAARTIYFPTTGAAGSTAINVTNNFTIDGVYQTLDMNNRRMRVYGNFTVNQTSRIINDFADGIILQPAAAAARTLTIGKLASANKFLISNTGGVTLTETATMGTLSLNAGVLNIQNKTLSVNNEITTTGAFSNTLMVKSNGLSGDGGLRYRYANIGPAASPFTYPVGVEAGATDKYTPFTLTLGGAGTFSNEDNYIGVTPVNSVHPIVVSSTNATLYYWKVNYSLVTPAPVGLTFNYRFDFIYADRITDGGSGSWRGYWTSGGTSSELGSYSSTNPTPNYVSYTALPTANRSGDFLGATVNAFNPGGIGQTFESNTANGAWNAAASWTLISGNGGTFPETGDVAVIKPGHKITVSAGRNEVCDYLNIQGGGTLDFSSATGTATFGNLVGDGLLRSSRAYLPTVTNAYTSFTNNYNSTIEFYGTTNYTIPSGTATFYNLLITGTGIKTLPDLALTVRNDIEINGAPVITGITAARNIAITNMLNLNTGGSLTFSGANAYNITAKSVSVSSGTITATAGAGYHSLTLTDGGISIEGTGVINAPYINTTITGANNVSIGTAANQVRFYTLTVNKTLATEEVVVDALLSLASSTPLTLTKGKLIIQTNGSASGVDITLASSGEFSIPAEASLLLGGTSTNHNIIRLGGSAKLNLGGVLSLYGTGEALFNGGVNNVEYTASGSSQLLIANTSVLTVGGQIMRPEATDGAILKYSQTGGTVTVGVNGASINTRGVFEVTGIGTTFTYTGGTLTIQRSSGYTSGDVFINPELYDISGSSTLSINSASASPTISINAAVPIGSLNISGTNTPTVKPIINNLVLRGGFTLGNGATFNTNNLDISVAGNFENNGVFTATAIGSFTFNGNDQALSGTGATTFNTLIVEPITRLTLNRNISVNGNMTINSGNLFDNGNIITLLGNLSNYSTHTGNAHNVGGFLLQGSTQQTITGGGYFNKIELDNPAGANLNGNAYLLGDIVLSDGMLTLGKYLLSLGLNSEIVSGSAFDNTNMLATNGDIGDEGVSKVFPAGTLSYTFPIGAATTPAKYTPVDISFNAGFSGGTMQVYPVNTFHTSISAGGDPSRVLQYYWSVYSPDITTATGTLIFHYIPTDVFGNIANYYSAQLVLTNDTWLKSAMTQDDKDNNRITFNFNNADADVINLTFLAGEESAIPDVVETWNSQASGDWDLPATWDKGTTPPQGAIVQINSGHKVDIATHNKRVYRTKIYGILDIDPSTAMHNFGLVEGSGTLSLESGIIPPGKWTGPNPFLACGGGTVEFNGTNSYVLDERYFTYENLIINGSGTKTLPDANITICNNLSVLGSVTFLNRENRKVDINGDLIKDNTASFSADLTNNITEFSGSEIQSISGTFTGANNRFNNLTVSQTYGLQVNNNVDIRNQLTTNSIINVSSSNRVYIDNISLEPTFNNNSYVDGLLSRNIEDHDAEVVYYIGDNTHKKITTLKDVQHSSGNKPWQIGYFFTSGPTPSSVGSGIGTVSAIEHWQITGQSGSSYIQLPLTGTSEIAAALGESNKSDLRIVGWNGTQWVIVGTGVAFTGTINAGTITTTTAVAFTGALQYFTLASVTAVTVSTATITSTNATICENGSYSLDISFTGTQPFILTYTIGATTHTTPAINNYTTQITLTNTQLPVGINTIQLQSLTGNGVAGVVFGDPVTVTVIAQPTQYVVGITSGSVCLGSTTNVTLSDSDTDYSYVLYQDGVSTGIIKAGTGSALTFEVGSSLAAGTYQYTIMGYYTALATCGRLMSGTANFTVNPIATIEIIDISATETCESDPYIITFEVITVEPNFSLTLRQAGLANADVILAKADLTPAVGEPTHYTYSINAVWEDQGGATPGSADYAYTVTVFTAGSCNSIIASSANITVWKTPETGPQYHVPNAFGF